MNDLLIAVDAGNSKTDVALLDTAGHVRSFVRGPVGSPQAVGLAGTIELLGRLLAEAGEQAGLSPRLPPAAVASLQMAGLDFPVEEQQFSEAAADCGWAEDLLVGNDTFALLRVGAVRGWGVAVVCGAGINCVGVAPDGRQVRFPAVGEISGDWGGGISVGLAAVAAAARSEDGRGPTTSLEADVPAHFGLERPLDLAEALHFGRIARDRLAELAPVVLASAKTDPVAASIVERLAAEVVALARAALVRLGLLAEPVDVILGGGILAAADPGLTSAIEAGLRTISTSITPRVVSARPIIGAALLALDRSGADASAEKRAEEELTRAIADLERLNRSLPR